MSKKKKLSMWINIYQLYGEGHYATSRYPYKTKKAAKAYILCLHKTGRQQYIRTAKIKIY